MSTKSKAMDVLSEAEDQYKKFYHGVIASIIISVIFFVAMVFAATRIFIPEKGMPGFLTHSVITEGDVTTNEYRDADGHLLYLFHINPEGELVVVDHDGRNYHSAVSEYENGREISWTIYSDTGHIRNEYNDDGVVITTSDAEGSIMKYYDVNSKLIRKEYFDSDRNSRIYSDWNSYRIDYSYTEDSITETRYLKDGFEKLYFDTNGKLERQEFFDLDWKSRTDLNFYRIDYSHTEDGIIETCYLEAGSEKVFFDSDGKQLRKELFDSDGNRRADSENGCYVFEWEYHPNSDKIAANVYYFEDYYIKNFFDEEETFIRQEKYHIDGTPLTDSDQNSTSSGSSDAPTLRKNEQSTPQIRELKVIITGYTVNLRSQPKADSQIVNTLTKYSILEYNETVEDAGGREWYSVTLSNGEDGWVSSMYSELTYVYE